MTTLTWCIFLPLLTAGVLLLIPASAKWLLKSVAILGTVLTFIISIGLVRNYSPDTTDAPAPAPHSAVSVLSSARDALIARADKGRQYEGVGGLERWKTDFLTPDAQGKYTLTVQQRASMTPAARETWDEAVELNYAMAVPQAKHLRFVEYVPWIPNFKINYFLGVDGLSLPLIWLTALLTVLCLVYSWTIDKGTKGFYILFLLLETGLIGVFCALDFFLFYCFWEIVLLPMYFLIGIWGGTKRLYAAIKFFLYTLVGSVLMLLVMLIMFFLTEPHTFNLLTLMHEVPGFAQSYPVLSIWLFVLLFIAFAIKIPVFPFHTWLPDAHVEAPTAVSVILAGILLKMGCYGLFRISYPMLPNMATQKFFIAMIAILGVINIIYGAFCALAQKDFKRLVAYSSVSHMGYVLLGLAALTHTGVTGAALQMFNHGVSSAMMFLIVGVIYDRAHHRDLSRFGGIGLQMPWYTGLATIGFFASLGLPGLNGFISEILCFLGAWDTDSSLITVAGDQGGLAAPWIVYVALLGIVLTAAYILWTIQRVYLGTVTNEDYKRFPDVSFREVVALAPLAVLCIVLGVYPSILLDFMNGSLVTLTDMVRTALGN